MELLTFRFPSLSYVSEVPRLMNDASSFPRQLPSLVLNDIPRTMSYQIFLLAGRSKNEACSCLLPFGQLRICSCLACVYRVMDARGKFGENERCVRFARGNSRVQL